MYWDLLITSANDTKIAGAGPSDGPSEDSLTAMLSGDGPIGKLFVATGGFWTAENHTAG